MKRLGGFVVAAVVACFFVSVAGAGGIVVESASPQQVAMLAAVLGDKYPVVDSVAVKSGQHGGAYYVGANFLAEGLAGKTTGVWLMGGSKSAPGLIFSVDGAAYQFSGMRRASETKAAAYISDPECKAIRKYLMAR